MADMKGIPSVKSPARDTADSSNMKLLRVDRTGAPFTRDFLWDLAHQGRIFYASDADQNDTVTGQTSFANTTPTFLLRVPQGTTAIPLHAHLSQTGTVAGAEITMIVEIDNADRYSSGGTAETVLSARTDSPVANQCTPYSGATASAAYGVSVYHAELIQDVDPAVADDWRWHNVLWVPSTPMLLVGPAAWLIYTFAGTTGPTWYWSLAWAEIPSSDLT